MMLILERTLSEIFDDKHPLGKQKQILLTLVDVNECSAGAIVGKAFNLHGEKCHFLG